MSSGTARYACEKLTKAIIIMCGEGAYSERLDKATVDGGLINVGEDYLRNNEDLLFVLK